MRKLYMIILLLSAVAAHAQDPQFTQFYASPMYLNPAFAGANVCSRLSTNYRNQWSAIPGSFVTYSASYDQAIPAFNSGAGIMFMNDQAGSGKLRATSINLLYSYEMQLTKKVSARLGIEAGRVTRAVNFYDLVFADQIARGGSNVATVEVPSMEKISYLDFSSGLLVYGKRFWTGISAHHINKPNESLMAFDTPLPVKLSVHAGYNLPVGTSTWKKREMESQFFSPAINYRAQGKFDQLDIGLYYNNLPVVLGVWYRGIPLFKSYEPGYRNDDAVAFLAGVTLYDNFRFGYSYDITLSRLTGSTNGSHEITLAYQFCSYKNMKKSKKRRPILIACPKF